MIRFLSLIVTLYGANVLVLENEFPWLFDDTKAKSIWDKKVLLADRHIEGTSLLWPAKAITTFDVNNVVFVNPFDLSTIPSVEAFFLEAVNHNSPSILGECKFPATISELCFQNDSLKIIKALQPKNFAAQIKYINIHKQNLKNVPEDEKEEIFSNLCQLINKNSGPNSVHVIVCTKKLLKNIRRSERESFTLEVKNYQHLDPISLAYETRVGMISEIIEELDPATEKYECMTNLNCWIFEELIFVDNLISNKILSQLSVFKLSTLFFGNVTFLDSFNLSFIPKVDTLSFHFVDGNHIQTSKLPATINTLIFGAGSLSVLNQLHSNNFTESVQTIQIHGASFMKLSQEDQETSIRHLCTLLTHVDRNVWANLELCVAIIKDEYLDTIIKGYITINVRHILDLLPLDFSEYKRVYIFKPITATSITLNSNQHEGDQLISPEIFFGSRRETIRIANCSIVWPKITVGILFFDNVVFTEPLDLSSIPSIGTLSFHHIVEEPNSEYVLKSSKFPNEIKTLTFGENSLRLIKTLSSSKNFASQIHRIFIYKTEFETFEKDEQEELLTNLCKLVGVGDGHCGTKIKNVVYEQLKKGSKIQPLFGTMIQINLKL